MGCPHVLLGAFAIAGRCMGPGPVRIGGGEVRREFDRRSVVGDGLLVTGAGEAAASAVVEGLRRRAAPQAALFQGLRVTGASGFAIARAEPEMELVAAPTKAVSPERETEMPK